jgi:hypothetical protein
MPCARPDRPVDVGGGAQRDPAGHHLGGRVVDVECRRSIGSTHWPSM